MYINYSRLTGLYIATYAQPTGYMNEDVGGLIDDMRKDIDSVCPLEGAKDVLEDGAYWNGSDVTEEDLEAVHNLITEYEEVE